MHDAVENCIVAVRPISGVAPEGGGFLVTKEHVLTCAHVVNACLNRSLEAQEQPGAGDVVRITFVADGGKVKSNAHVIHWLPPLLEDSGGTSFDAAILKLDSAPPSGFTIAPLRIRTALSGKAFSTFGFPMRFPAGQSQSGTLGQQDALQRYELLEGEDKRPFVRPGFSGSPVKHNERIIGMIVAAREAEEEKTGYMIAIEHLQSLIQNLDVAIGYGIVDDFPHLKVIQAHLNEVTLRIKTGRTFDLRAKKVKTTEEIAQLFRGTQPEYDEDALRPEDVLNDQGLSLLLQSPGGAGKTNFLATLIRIAIARGAVPFLLDATRSASDVPNWSLDSLMSKFAVAGGMEDFEKAKKEVERHRIILIADRLNENPKNASAILQTLIRAATNEAPGIRIIAADRLKSRLDDIAPLERSTLLPLPASEIMKFIDTPLGGSVSNSQLKLWAMPFFLEMKLSSGKKDAAVAPLTRAKMFKDFFELHVGIKAHELPKLAEAAFKAFKEHKNTVMPLAEWTKLLGEDGDLGQRVLTGALLQYQRDREGEKEEVVEFRHQLLHDFLAGTHVRLSPESLWRAEIFDGATLEAQSFDAIEFAAEQLEGRADEFLKQVYDWNYVAVLESIRNLDAQRHGGMSPLSVELKDAVYCLNVLRVSDRFAHTRKRIESIIEDLKPKSNLDLASASTFAVLRERVRSSYLPQSSYFLEWKGLFLKDDRVKQTDFRQLWRDPLMSWTAANIFRRLEWDAGVVEALQTNYYAVLNTGAVQPEAIGARWRIVHLLGSRPESLLFLWEVTKSSAEDKWVRAGAARSLAEAASLLESPVDRQSILKDVAEWVLQATRIPDPVLDELRQTAMLAPGESIPEGWYAHYRGVLEAGANHARSRGTAEQEKAWRKRIEEISVY
jgi:hypothetical protein